MNPDPVLDTCLPTEAWKAKEGHLKPDPPPTQNLPARRNTKVEGGTPEK
jgi:hypothetical protein